MSLALAPARVCFFYSTLIQWKGWRLIINDLGLRSGVITLTTRVIANVNLSGGLMVGLCGDKQSVLDCFGKPMSHFGTLPLAWAWNNMGSICTGSSINVSLSPCQFTNNMTIQCCIDMTRRQASGLLTGLNSPTSSLSLIQLPKFILALAYIIQANV
jgi:hypothetical protein